MINCKDAYIELTVDETGVPKLTFLHHDKSSHLEQKLLGLFAKEAIKNGISIRKVSGHSDPTNEISFDKYEIVIK